jgi:hypothetical protein
MALSGVTAYAFEHGNLRALRAFVPLVGDGGAVGPMHICMEGEWMGHPAGPFKITAGDIDQMIATFDPQKNPMMVDYGHRSLNETGTPDDLKAAGWVQTLEKRDGADGAELWATVEWTPKAADAIKQGEFRYCSPVIDYQPIDRKSGAEGGVELFNVAITNQPFLDGQHPIRLTRVAATFPPKKPGDAKPEDKQAAAPSDKPDAPAPDASKPDAPPQTQPGTPEDKAEDAADGGADDAAEGETAAGDAPDAPDAPDANAAPPAPPVPSVSPEDNVVAAMLDTFISSVMSASGLSKPAVCAELNNYADQIGSALKQKSERDGTPAEERLMSDQPVKPVADITAAPDAETPDAKRLDAIEGKRKDDLIVAMAARLEKLEAKEGERDTKAQADHKRMIAAHVAKLVTTGYVREGGQEDAVWAFTADFARAEKIYAEQVVPVRRTQAGADPAPELKKLDVATAKLEDLEPHEQQVFLSQKRAGKSDEKAMSVVLAARNKINAQARAIGLVH